MIGFTDDGEEAIEPFRLDRALQRRILDCLSAHYPQDAFIYDEMPEAGHLVAAHLVYLEEHGLCESGVQIGIDGHIGTGPARITARGLDFLEDDGGLSAILGVVTIRLEADTLKALINARIDQSDLPVAEKSRLKKHLGSLSEAALKEATKELAKRGLDHLPDAIQWLQRLAGLG